MKKRRTRITAHKVEWQQPQPYVRIFGKYTPIEEREKPKYEELGFKIEYF